MHLPSSCVCCFKVAFLSSWSSNVVLSENFRSVSITASNKEKCQLLEDMNGHEDKTDKALRHHELNGIVMGLVVPKLQIRWRIRMSREMQLFGESERIVNSEEKVNKPHLRL